MRKIYLWLVDVVNGVSNDAAVHFNWWDSEKKEPEKLNIQSTFDIRQIKKEK